MITDKKPHYRYQSHYQQWTLQDAYEWYMRRVYWPYYLPAKS